MTDIDGHTVRQVSPDFTPTPGPACRRCAHLLTVTPPGSHSRTPACACYGTPLHPAFAPSPCPVRQREEHYAAHPPPPVPEPPIFEVLT